MVWYVPPLSPLVKSGITNAESLDNMRIPLKYLANLLAAGDEKPVRRALEKAAGHAGIHKVRKIRPE